MADVCIRIKKNIHFECPVEEQAYRFRKSDLHDRYWFIHKMYDHYRIKTMRETFFYGMPRTSDGGFTSTEETVTLDWPDFCIKFSPQRELHQTLAVGKTLRRLPTDGPHRILTGYDAQDRWHLGYGNQDITSIWNFSNPGSGWPVVLYVPALKQEVSITTQPGEILFFRGNLCPYRRPLFVNKEHLYFSLFYQAEPLNRY